MSENINAINNNHRVFCKKIMFSVLDECKYTNSD